MMSALPALRKPAEDIIITSWAPSRVRPWRADVSGVMSGQESRVHGLPCNYSVRLRGGKNEKWKQMRLLVRETPFNRSQNPKSNAACLQRTQTRPWFLFLLQVSDQWWSDFMAAVFIYPADKLALWSRPVPIILQIYRLAVTASIIFHHHVSI